MRFQHQPRVSPEPATFDEAFREIGRRTVGGGPRPPASTRSRSTATSAAAARILRTARACRRSRAQRTARPFSSPNWPGCGREKRHPLPVRTAPPGGEPQGLSGARAGSGSPAYPPAQTSLSRSRIA